MKITYGLWHFLIGASLFATGCNKKSEDAPTGTPPTAAAKVTCSDAAFKHSDPTFCVDVPAGFEAGPEKKSPTGTEVVLSQKSSKDEWVKISWGRYKTAADAVQSIKTPNEGDKVIEQSELPGGGYYMHTTDSDGEHNVWTVSNGSKAFVDCYTATKKPDVLAAGIKTCKSIKVD